MIKLKLTKLIPLMLLALLAAILCFYKLQATPLSYWDEYTNFNVVYDTINSNNSLILKKNNWFSYGKLDDGSFHPSQRLVRPWRKLSTNNFLEKPPLWYYVTIFTTKIFGVNNFSVRIVSALSGFLMIMLLFYVGWKIFSYKAGIIAGFCALATRQLFLVSSSVFSTHTFRSADLDSLQVLFITLTTLSLFNFQRFTRTKHKYLWLIFAGIFTGLGFLTKGPVSLIPLFVLFLYQLIKIKEIGVKRLLIQLLILNSTFLILVVPWHLFMYLKFGKEFIDTYFLYHLFARGTSGIENHTGSIFFYLKTLFHKDIFFSAEIFLAAIVYYFVKFFRKMRSVTAFYRQLSTVNCSLFFCFSSSLLILLLISISATKLSWYLLPAYPFIFLLMGKFFNDLWNIRKCIIRNVALVIFVVALTVQVGINLHLVLGIQ